MEVAAFALAVLICIGFALLMVLMWRSAAAQRGRDYEPRSPTLRWITSLISGDHNRRS
jgi:hypothetical protein